VWIGRWDGQFGNSSTLSRALKRKSVSWWTSRIPVTLGDSEPSVLVIFRRLANTGPISPTGSDEGFPLTRPFTVKKPRLMDHPIVNTKDSDAITLMLPGSYVFTVSKGKSQPAVFGEPHGQRQIATHCRIKLPYNLGVPSTMILGQHGSWTESRDDGIKAFSGTANYAKCLVALVVQCFRPHPPNPLLPHREGGNPNKALGQKRSSQFGPNTSLTLAAKSSKENGFCTNGTSSSRIPRFAMTSAV
jgi:hypothetical protein